jgi:hypothetical protein
MSQKFTTSKELEVKGVRNKNNDENIKTVRYRGVQVRMK